MILASVPSPLEGEGGQRPDEGKLKGSSKFLLPLIRASRTFSLKGRRIHSPQRCYIKKSQNGFTLIEILVGLVIIAIALTALIQASIYYRNTVVYLKQKSVAQWIASNVYQEYSSGISPIPLTLSNQSGEIRQLNQQWYWDANFTNIPESPFIKITIVVKTNAAHAPVLQLSGYLTNKSSPS